MPILEYNKWENFNNAIQKAVISYKNSNNDDPYWLPEVRKPIITGKDIRAFIKKQGGTMPEDMPTPKKSLKELEKEKL